MQKIAQPGLFSRPLFPSLFERDITITRKGAPSLVGNATPLQNMLGAELTLATKWAYRILSRTLVVRATVTPRSIRVPLGPCATLTPSYAILSVRRGKPCELGFTTAVDATARLGRPGRFVAVTRPPFQGPRREDGGSDAHQCMSQCAREAPTRPPQLVPIVSH